jgi:hypothetical protein
MVTCANITLEKIRAEISFGALAFETPDVKSFNVTRSRGQLAATFSASVEVPATTVFPVDQDVVIKAGIEGDLKTIFTGKVLSITVNPSFERATTYVVNMSGSDRLHELEGKTISRRQRARAASTFAAITGISSRRPQRGVSTEKRKQSGGSNRLANPDTNIREHSKIVRTDRVSWDPFDSAVAPSDDQAQQADEVANVIDIKPRAVSLSPGVSVRFNIENTEYQTGDAWQVSDSQIGTIKDNEDGTATYTQLALGENTIEFLQGEGAETTFTGKATAVGIPIHDHSSLGQGGPAFGVYGSD